MTLRELHAFSVELPAAYARNDGDRASVLALQQARLDALVAAARRAPRYRALRCFADAPVVDKAALQARFDEHVVDGAPRRVDVAAFLARARPGTLLRDRYVVATTSGTTGEVGLFLTEDAAFARLRATVFARIFRGQLRAEGFALLARRRYRLAFVVATAGHTMTSVLALRVPRLGRAFADVRTLSIDERLSDIVDALNATPPQLLHSYSTVLEVLAHEQRRGRLRIAPEIVTAGSEPLTAQARAALARAFPTATLLETWGATENIALAVSCPLGHLHVNEDVALLEPVDDDDRAVPAGTWSDRVLVTNLLNHAQPLLRYRLDDRVRVDPTPCPCGSPFLRVEVVGRTDDVLYLDDGVDLQAHPPIPFEIALLGTPGLLQFALVHERQNVLRLSIVVEEGADPITVGADVTARMAAYLDDHGLTATVTFYVEQVDALLRHARSRKLRQITSRVPRPTRSVPAATKRRSP